LIDYKSFYAESGILVPVYATSSTKLSCNNIVVVVVVDDDDDDDVLVII